MGGVGSGNRCRTDAKSITSDFRLIDVRRWAREGVLEPGRIGAWQWSDGERVVASVLVRAQLDSIVLDYRYRTAGGRWTNEEYAVTVERTRTRFGGDRPWFICPAASCGRRVAILYGGAIFACRQCRHLAYGSSRENARDRAIRAAEKLRGRLGWKAGIANAEGDRPKWMRWRTFQKLKRQHDRFVARAVGMLVAELRLPRR